MLTRIEVAPRDLPGASGDTDSLGRKIAASIREDLGLAIDGVRTANIYTLELDLRPGEAERIARELLTDPVTEAFAIDAPLAGAFDFAVEVGYKPGVTDNVGRSAREGVEDLLGRRLAEGEAVYTARQYLLRGPLDREAAERIAAKLLANGLIQDIRILSREEWAAGRRFPARSHKVSIPHQPAVAAIPLPDSDSELERISRERVLALTVEEMRAIRDHYARPEVAARRRAAGLPAHPTDVELEVLAQTWSEHCKHKIFSADIDYEDGEGRRKVIHSVFKTYVKATTEAVRDRAPWLKSVFWDNAGIIAFTDEYDIAMKAETHNSPSALDPYGGAMTGIVGVNRDILGAGIGCKPIFNTDVFCFASPFYDRPVPEKLHHPRRMLREVHRGVKDGGNESGIPTVNGSMVFDDRFLGKPLVFCGTGGLIPARVNDQESWRKEVRPGDRVVAAGGRIGKDGIHGATFSSAALTEASPTSAVQIGDPITQKKVLDFMLEARDLGLYRYVQDNGAGGLSSSLGEMAGFSGGARIHLDRAPLKYAGLDPWEIFVSEAQERMSFAVPPGNLAEFLALAARRGVEATDLGEFTDHGFLTAYFRGEPVAELDINFLHEGNPKLKLRARFVPPRHPEPEPAFLAARPLADDALALLGALDICSKESWVRQYDHEVQGMSVVKPFTGAAQDGPSDAAVLRPVANRPEGLVVAHGIVPRYSDIDCYHMTACAIDEAVRNAVAAGGRPGDLAALDNYCWPDPVESPDTPDGAQKLAQLVRSGEALKDLCVLYGLPLISGKDSMKNDYGKGAGKISIPPTVLITVIGKLRDVGRAVTMDAKAAGDLVYALGETRDELGGSEYLKLLGYVGNSVPVVDGERNLALYLALADAMSAGLVRSAHDCSDGGLFVALAEAAMAGRLGMDLDLGALPGAGGLSDAAALFAESQGRFVITVAPDKASAFERALAGHACARLGAVTAGPDLALSRGGRRLFSLGLDRMFAAWRRPLDF